MTQSLTERFLAVNTAPPRAARKANPERDFTKRIEVSGDSAEATLRGAPGEVGEDAARSVLLEKGLDPDEWAVTGFRSSEWTRANGELGESNRFSFRRIAESAPAGVPFDDLIRLIEERPPASPDPLPQGGGFGYIVALGDMQFGKDDGDGAEGTLARCLSNVDRAAERLADYRKTHEIGHVHLAWLGDHIEGFVSQGGANAWRTRLTLTEQTRLVRRVMLYAIDRFAPLAGRLTVVAIPGNHGDPQRFNGKGVTRYDDSHDTEALIAVGEAIALNPGAYSHVEIYTPEPDELTVVIEVAGTVVAHAHGHQWRPGRHFDWWEKQAFGGPGLQQADLLLAGHLHHEFIEARGTRLFVQVPALESESTWWRHATGQVGDPGIVVLITRDGVTNIKEVIR